MLKKIVALGVLIVIALSFAACGIDFSFEGRCKTSEDGFVYYEDKEIGLCIISLPDSEEVVIPEYIDGKRVVQLGYEQVGIAVRRTHWVDGKNVKKLTIQHTFIWYAAMFPIIEILTIVDLPYCFFLENNTLKVPDHVGTNYPINPVVELRKSDRQLDLSEFKCEIINVPEYVAIIDAQVFDGLTGVTIRTSYQSKPQGWEDGWNGNCPVEWGVEI